MHFSSSDGQGVLPSADYTFTGSDHGVHVFSNAVILKTVGSGSQSITATDSAHGVSGSATISMTAAAAHSLVLTAPGTATAGTAFTVTITAYDSYGNIATGYTGSVHFSSSDSHAVLPSSNYTFTGADHGVHTFSNSVTLKTVGGGSQSITVTDTPNSLSNSASVSLTAATASSLTVTAPGSSTAGSAFNVTVTLYDTYGNMATGYSGTVHFSSSDSHVVLANSDYTFTAADHGVHVFLNAVTLKKVGGGSQTVTATDAADSLSGSATVSMTAGAAHSLIVTAPSSTTAGIAMTVTVTACDAYGNIATGYTGSVHFSSSDSSAVLPSLDFTFTGADRGVHVFSSGVTLKTVGSGSQTVTATDSADSLSNFATVSVNAATATSLALSAPANATAGSPFTVTVTVYDSYGNIATGYTGTVHFSSSDSRAVLPSPDYTFTSADQGVQIFDNGVTLKKIGNGSQTVTATDLADSLSNSASVSVAAATAHSLTVIAPASGTAGSAMTVTIKACDTYGNVATTYTGTVHFSSSDSSAVLPNADYTFTSADHGVHVFTNGVTFKTVGSGSQAFTATDTIDSLTGSTTVSLTAGAAHSLAVTAPASAIAGGAFTITVTAFDSYGNVATGYTGSVHFSSSDSSAVLPSPDYTFLAADHGVHIFANGVTFKTVGGGSQTITATDATDSISGSATVNLTAATASSLSVTGPANATAGGAFTITVMAFDSYGNIATGYTGSVHFSSSDSHGVLPSTDYSFMGADHGIHIFANAVTLKTVGGGSQTLTATDTTDSLSGLATVSLTAGAAHSLAVTAPASAIAGGAFTITVTVLDSYGNVATGYTGSVHFSSSDSSAVLPSPDYTFSAADHGVHLFANSVTLKTVGGGSQAITVTDATDGISGSATVNLTVATANSLSVTGPASAMAGGAFTITVTALDSYGNVAGGYTGSVHFSSSDSHAVLPSPDYTFTGADHGVHIFSNGVTLKTVGGGSQTIAVTDTADSLSVSATVSLTAATAHSLNISAWKHHGGYAIFSDRHSADAYGNVATSYNGTIHLTSSDTQAALPAPDYTFTGADHGIHVFANSVTLKSGGTQTVTVADKSNSGITGISNIITVNYTADQGYIEALFHDILGRSAGYTELTAWVANLNQPGQTKLAVVTAIEQSTEGRMHLVAGWYALYLGRTGSSTEMQGWVNMLAQGATEDQIQAQIMSSAEFAARANAHFGSSNSNANYVSALYQLLFNRTPSPSDSSGWVSALAALSRAALAQMFLESVEHRTLQVGADYSTLLHRTGSTADIAGWVNGPDSLAQIRYLFESTEEFYLDG